MAFPWRRRDVMLDTNVYYARVHSPRGEGAKVVDKAIDEDDLQITSINYEESLHAAGKSEDRDVRRGKTPRVTMDKMRDALDDILRRSGKNVEGIDAPDAETLQKRYNIRDVDDARILYAAEMTDSEILVTGDKDYYQPDLNCPDGLTLVKPREHIEEKRSAYALKRIAGRFRR